MAEHPARQFFLPVRRQTIEEDRVFHRCVRCKRPRVLWVVSGPIEVGPNVTTLLNRSS
jgi:hypothetical protein